MRLRFWTAVFFVAIAALPYLLLVATRAPREAPVPAEAEVLTILSPHRREVRGEYRRAFRDWMRRTQGREVDIRWLDVGGSSKMLKELESRYAAASNNPGADLIFGGGIAPYVTAGRQGWLQTLTLTPDARAAIPPACTGAPVYDLTNGWAGVALSGFGILYNRPVLERLGLPVPRDWDDLGRPEFYSWVGSGDPRSSGSVHMCYEIILQSGGFEAGWNLIVRLCANVRAFGESGSVVPREVAAGDIAAGMAIDQYAMTVTEAVGGDRLVFVLPQRRTVINADPIGLLRGAPHATLAREFIVFALSEAGQRLLYQPAGTNGQRTALYRMPVRADLYRDPLAPRPNPYTLPAGMTYNTEKSSRRWDTLNDLCGVWLLDAHADLRQAWQAVIRRGCRPEEVARLTAPPVSEAELDALRQVWRDPRRRETILRRWSDEARARYRALAGG